MSRGLWGLVELLRGLLVQRGDRGLLLRQGLGVVVEDGVDVRPVLRLEGLESLLVRGGELLDLVF